VELPRLQSQVKKVRRLRSWERAQILRRIMREKPRDIKNLEPFILRLRQLLGVGKPATFSEADVWRDCEDIVMFEHHGCSYKAVTQIDGKWYCCIHAKVRKNA
jgi:hypothetical protein